MVDISENIKDAKSYLLKRHIEKDSKYRNISDISPEDSKKIIASHLDFSWLLNLLKDSPNYVYPFTLLLFGETGENVNTENIKTLLKELKKYKNSLNKLPKQVFQYSKIKKTNSSPGGFELLIDDLRNIEREQNAKWLINTFPSNLKASYKKSTEAIKKEFFSLVNYWMAGNPGIENLNKKVAKRDSLIKGISRYHTFDEFLDIFREVASAGDSKGIEGMVRKISEFSSDNLSAIMINPIDEILPIFILDYKAQISLCSVANWCIQKKETFDTYVRDDRIQLNIYDFNKRIGTRYHLIGITLGGDLEVYSSANLTNGSIPGSTLKEILTGLRYSDEVINSIITTATFVSQIKKNNMKLLSLQKDPKNFLNTKRKERDNSIDNILYYKLLLEYGEDEFEKMLSSENLDKNTVNEIREKTLNNYNRTIKEIAPEVIQYFSTHGIASNLEYEIFENKFKPLASKISIEHILEKTKKIYKALSVILDHIEKFPIETAAVYTPQKAKGYKKLFKETIGIIKKLEDNVEKTNESIHIKNYPDFLASL